MSIKTFSHADKRDKLRHCPKLFPTSLRESHHQFMRTLASDIQLPFFYGRRTVAITDQGISDPIRS
jgi:hypothetical protein